MESSKAQDACSGSCRYFEWVRPAAAAGFVFRMRDLEAAEEVAGAVEDQALLLEEPAERQSIYEELAGRTYEADEK